MTLFSWLLRHFVLNCIVSLDQPIFNGPNLKNFITILSAFGFGFFYDQVFDYFFDHKAFINWDKPSGI